MSRPLGRRGLLLGTGGLLAAPAIARAQKTNAGVALVIGNSKYRWEASLPNAKRDATDVARCFQEMGLKTELIEDAGRETILRALDRLRSTSSGADFAAFYFAGHGVAAGKDTYVVPVDTDLSDPSTVKSLVRVRNVVDAMPEAKYRFLVFDNCRNSPADGWRQREAIDRAQGSGISQYGDGEKLPPNSHVLYSTAPGRAAVDGPAGQNSPFTTVLLRHLGAAKVDLFNLNPHLRRDLLIETEGRQLIWAEHSYAKPHVIDGAGRPAESRRARFIEPSRIVDLNNAYRFLKEINAPLPAGIVVIRPAKSSPDAQLVGSYKFMGRENSPALWIVLSVTHKTAEIVMAQRKGGNPTWRYFPGKISGSTLEARTWSNGEDYSLTWKDANSGRLSAQILTRIEDPRFRTHFQADFTRLDG
jgi:hypothetical protein